MERKIGLIVLVFCLSLCIKAQIKPVFNVSGPEVSNLGEYGTIPVGHYTGVPDISIPLYNVQIGDYELPISLSYHLDNSPWYIRSRMELESWWLYSPFSKRTNR